MEHENFINDIIQHFQALDKFTPNRLMAIKDKNLKYVYVNGGFANIYGLKSNLIVGKSELEIKSKLAIGYSAKDEHSIINNNQIEYYLNISTKMVNRFQLYFLKRQLQIQIMAMWQES